MKLLSVDSSGKSAAVAITVGETVIAENFENRGFTHSETLLPLVDDTLRKARLTIGEIDAFAVTVGPGSFTGLRIGCALVKGLAGDKPCYPVPTLKALAYNLRSSQGIVIPLMDARCRQVYSATYEADNKTMRRVTADRAVAVEEVVKDICSYLAEGKTVTVLGDGAHLLPQEIADKVRRAPEDKLLIRGPSVAAAAQDAAAVDAARLTLEYLRLSQAEREKKKTEEKAK